MNKNSLDISLGFGEWSEWSIVGVGMRFEMESEWRVEG